MKYLLTTTFSLLIIIFCLSAFAQPPKNHPEKREQIEALRISFITQRLDLTREEAQRFWPVYNEYHDALESLRKERREEMKNYRERCSEVK